MPKFSKPKIVIDPLLGLIDITEVIPLMDTAPFQSLGFKYQLGLTYSVFPAATHTRKQHCLGAYERTKNLAEDWLDYGFINEKEARHLPIFALYHDLGHGPFSHVTEPIGSVDHDERGLQILEGLEDQVEAAGFDYDLLYDIFSRENPLYKAVFDKNLGMEKLDYLERDAFYTIGERPGVEYLAHHVYFIDDKVAISEVAVDQAKDIQDFYIKMYKHVYTRKKSAILQRLVEKMTYYLVEQEGLGEKELFNMTDFGLMGKFETSPNDDIRYYYDRFQKGLFPKLSIEFKDKEVLSGAYIGTEDKPTRKVGIPSQDFNEVILSEEFKDLAFLEEFEDEIAEITDIPREAIVVVQPQSLRRFEPTDINVYMQNGELDTISNIYPDHFQAMREYGRSHLSLRVCTYPEYREKLSKQSKDVKDFILNMEN